MEQKYGEFVGVDSVHFAKLTKDDETEYTPEAPKYLAPVAEIAGEPEINNKTTYYDNKAANNYVTEGKTPLQLTVSNVPAALAAEILGKHYDAVSGRVYDEGAADPPVCALGFRYNMGTDGFRYYWYLKGTFSGGAEEASSKKEDVDIKTYQLTFTAVTTTHEWEIDGKNKSLKRIFADTSDVTFDKTGWFDQVQTPDSVGNPTAVALSSIVPADDADTIAVDSNIVLTFNNRIASEAITVIESGGTIVAGAKSWDSTGKILTFTPTDDLDASSTYIVAVNGVVDIYGQALAADAKNFETA
jgi:phi13 family phage major tail protein